MQVKDHTFVVTGGSSGLGAACVRTLAGGGGNVIVADLNRAGGEARSGGTRLQSALCRHGCHR